MAGIDKDSTIIVIRETEDGFTVNVWKWPVSPPPVPHRDLFFTNPPSDFATERTAADKTELKAKLAGYIDSIFAQ